MLALSYGPAGFENSDWISLAVIFAVMVLFGVVVSLRRRTHPPRS